MKARKRVSPGIISTVMALIMVISSSACVMAAGTDTIGDNGVDVKKEIEALPIEEKEKVEEVKSSGDKMLDTRNEFAVGLFKQVYSKAEKNDNVMISPISMHTALSMLSELASGQTETELDEVLAGGEGIEKLGEANKKNIANITGADGVTIKISNGLWVSDIVNINSVERTDKVKNIYDAEMSITSFADQQVVQLINGWAARATDNKITSIIDSVEDGDIAILANAVYLKADWKTQFESEWTKEALFKQADGTSKSVDFMRETESLKLIDSKDAVGVIKPYKNKDYNFVALIPKNGDMQSLVSGMTAPKFKSIVKEGKVRKVSLSMPKFKMENEYNMNESVSDMGMSSMFSPRGDFSDFATGMSGETVYVDNILHKTFFEVNELGTEAGAVTAVMMYNTSVEIEKPAILNLNQPFICAVTGPNEEILFIGVVNNVQ